ncbi:MAG: YhgE/Pip domain-containing protein [Sarcina sp.]
MKKMKVFKIFKKDLKNIVKNPVAIIIILGLCIIPSLYTWITLKANWNPYVDTGNVPVAVVNEDTGTIIDNQIVNVGNQIVNQLKQNNSIKWTFVGKDVANQGLKSGEYYAEIIIPNNFSSDLATLSTGSPVKPNIIYKVNEKTNAIATKITDIAASQLQQQITQSFVQGVNEAVLKEANVLGNNIQKNEPMILQLKGVIASTNSNVAQIKGNLNEATGNVNDLTNYLNNLENNIPEITAKINTLQSVVGASQNLLQTSQNTVNNVSSSVSSGVSSMNQNNSEIQGFINQLKTLNETASNTTAMEKVIANAITTNDKLTTITNTVINNLQGINKLLNSSIISNLISKLDGINTQLASQNTQLNAVKTLLDNKGTSVEIAKSLDSLSNVSNEISSNISNFGNDFNSNGVASINSLSSNINSSLAAVNSILADTKTIIPQLQAINKLGISAGNLTASKTEEISQKLNSLEQTLTSLENKTASLNSSNLNSLVNLLEKNPNQIASFMSSPVNMKVEELYGMSVFGIGLAPFYTVLSIWVGALLLTSILKVNDPTEEDGTKKTILQIHFGKMLLFLIVNFIQGTIVTLGDVFLLGIKPENLWLLLSFAWFSGVTFTIIIFTLVSLLGNMGKAAAIVIMVMQVAGTGAIYPIQVNPEILQKLQFLWPFTYAIDGFREAIGGPDWTKVTHDFKCLAIFLVIFLLLGVLIMIMHDGTEKMEHLFRESGL